MCSQIQTSIYFQEHALEPPHGKCNDSGELEYFTTYSMSTCLIDCKQRHIVAKCGCRDIYMPSGDPPIPVCTLHKYETCMLPAIGKIQLVTLLLALTYVYWCFTHYLYFYFCNPETGYKKYPLIFYEEAVMHNTCISSYNATMGSVDYIVITVGKLSYISIFLDPPLF